MSFNSFLSLFTADPVATAKTMLRFVHFIGLAIGLGGATLLDLILLKFFLLGRIEKPAFDVFHFAASTVDIGLRILWLTGIGFLIYYALVSPELLQNPKVHAKLVIVLILTLNGYFIHGLILPHVRSQVGRSIFDGVSSKRRVTFMISAAVSVVSWYTPVALGVFSQLNFSVPAQFLLLIYFSLIAGLALVLNLVVIIAARIRGVEPDLNATEPDFRRATTHVTAGE